ALPEFARIANRRSRRRHHRSARAVGGFPPVTVPEPGERHGPAPAPAPAARRTGLRGDQRRGPALAGPRGMLPAGSRGLEGRSWLSDPLEEGYAQVLYRACATGSGGGCLGALYPATRRKTDRLRVLPARRR